MKREEMLAILRNIPVGARPTVYTMDMGVQYEYVTKDGCGESLGSMGDWPVHVARNISSQMLYEIQQLITERLLSIEKIQETGLGKFFAYVFGCDRPGIGHLDINTFFAGLGNLNGVEKDSIYILCDGREWNPQPYFYENYEELVEAFKKQYVHEVICWDQLENDELAYWIDEINSNLSSVFLNEFG